MTELSDGNKSIIDSDISPYERLVELTKKLSVAELAKLAPDFEKLLRAKLGVEAADVFSVVFTSPQVLGADYWAIQTWLLGKEKLPPDAPSPGRAALVRWARAQNDPIADLLAGVLEPIGRFNMRLELKRRPGRPSNDVQQAIEDLRLGGTIETKIDAETQGGRKPNRKAVTGAAAAKVGKGRSSGYDARAKFKRAKSLESLEEE
jgi:hypothetical protein